MKRENFKTIKGEQSPDITGDTEMLKYQLIHVISDNSMFVALFEESAKDKAGNGYDIMKMQKYVKSAMLVELDANNCTGKILKSYKE